MVTCIEKLGELREHPNVKDEDNPEPSLIMKNKKIKVECAVCGKPKEVSSCDFNKNTTGNFYCDRECLRKGHSANSKGAKNPFYGKKHSQETLQEITGSGHWNYGNRKHKDKECPNCGEVFNSRNKYCCSDCSHKSRRARVTRPCGTCGKPVTRTQCYVGMNKHFFCDYFCNGKYNGMNQPTGENAYWYGKRKEDTPNWRGGLSFEPYGIDFDDDLKDKIRARDNYKCQICESEGDRKLDVHHIDYDKMNNKEDNLIALCRTCHCSTNGNRKYWTLRLSFHNQKGATTIPEVGVHSSEWKRRASQVDDDIVCSYGRP